MTNWNLDHNPLKRPLGCNRKPGDSGRNAHRRKGEAPCEKCREAANHAKRERRRGQPHPRRLKPCGTPSAARRHRYNNEPLDFACKLAESKEHAKLRAEKELEMKTTTYAYDAEPGARPEEFTCAVIEGYSKDPGCQHEATDNQGVCLDCEQPVENWEPSDGQIPGTYEIRKAA